MAEKIDIIDSAKAEKDLAKISKLLVDLEKQMATISASAVTLNTSLGGIKSITGLTTEVKKLRGEQEKSSAVSKELQKLKDQEIALEAKLKVAYTSTAKSVNDKKKKLADINQQQKSNTKSLRDLIAEEKRESTEKEKTIAKLERERKARLKVSDSVESNRKALEKQKAAALKSAAATDKLTNSSKRTSNAFGGLLGGIKSLVAAFGIIAGIQIFGSILKDVFNLMKTFDSLGFTMVKITQNSYDLASSSIFLKQITKDFGVELVTTTNRYIKFLAAAKQSGITIGQTEDIFRSMTKAASVLGLKTDELSGIYLALEQMLSKGKVTTEELRRQLGERLPGAMGIMASSLGVTIVQLDKMLKKGEVLSAEALPKFAKAVESAYGIETVKKVETLVASQNRLSNSWKNFIATVTEGETLVKIALRGTMEYLAGFFDFYADMFATNDQKVLISRIKWGHSISDNFDTTVKNLLKQQKGYVDRSDDLAKKMAQTQLDIIQETDTEKKKLLQAHLDELGFLRAEDAAKAEEVGLRVALSQLDGAKNTMDAEKALYIQYTEVINKIKDGSIGSVDRKKWKDQFVSLGINDIEDIIDRVGKAEARWDFLRKKVETGMNVPAIPEEVGETSKKTYEYLFGSIGYIEELIKSYDELIKREIDPKRRAELNIQLDALKEIKDELEGINKETKDIVPFSLLPKADDFNLRDFTDGLAKSLELNEDFVSDAVGDFLESGLTDFETYYKKLVDLASKSGRLRKEVEQKVFDFTRELTDSIFEVKIQKLEEDIEKSNEYYDNQIELQEGNAEKQDNLKAEQAIKEKELQKKADKEKKKQFLAEKALSIAQIWINHAQTLTKQAAMFPPPLNLPLIPLVWQNTLLSLGTVAAQMIPKFKEGTLSAPKGIALVGDGGKHEYIEDKLGNITQTPNVDTLVNLGGGEKIHKDLDSLAISKGYSTDDIYKATLLTSLASERRISSYKLERLFDENLKGLKDDLKKGIKEGFANVSMHNHTTVDFNHSIYRNNTL